jgi:hypothetical protein
MQAEDQSSNRNDDQKAAKDECKKIFRIALLRFANFMLAAFQSAE